MVAGKQQPFVKGRCSGLFCNGGNPVVQPQGVFLFSFYLKVSTGQWTPDENCCPNITPLPCTVVDVPQIKDAGTVVSLQHLTSTGFSNLFCKFFSSKTKLGLQLYPCFLQGKSLYIMRLILRFSSLEISASFVLLLQFVNIFIFTCFFLF